jgi:hypothetical protein
MSLGKKDRLSWRNRLKLCWEVFCWGKYDPRDYKTIQQEEAWERCEQMREELDSCIRERKPFSYKYPADEQ